MLPAFGIIGIQQVPVPGMPGRFIYVRAEDGGVAHQLIMYREYEPFESQLVRERLSPEATVFNIGSNLGYYTLLASECVGRTGRVFAFEPEPNNLELLRRTISENECSNVELQPVAVSEHSGVATLSLSETNSGDHQLTNVIGRNQVQVPKISLDDFIAQGHPSPGAVIMDVQGSELEVLRGATSLLAANRPLVLFTEFWQAGLNTRHPNGANEFLGILERAGFQLALIDESKKILNSVSTEWLLKYVTGNMEVNLLAIRS